MPKFTAETAAIAVELQQLMGEWCRELDIHGGADIARLCTEDCRYHVGGTLYPGHAPITAFYAARNERVATQQRDGVRTQRHSISNFLVDIKDAGSAGITFTLVNYSAEGKAPALNLVGPTIVADVQMECALGGDGVWRISMFDSQPIFIGNDPFLNANVVKK